MCPSSPWGFVPPNRQHSAPSEGGDAPPSAGDRVLSAVSGSGDTRRSPHCPWGWGCLRLPIRSGELVTSARPQLCPRLSRGAVSCDDGRRDRAHLCGGSWWNARCLLQMSQRNRTGTELRLPSTLVTPLRLRVGVSPEPQAPSPATVRAACPSLLRLGAPPRGLGGSLQVGVWVTSSPCAITSDVTDDTLV